LPPCYTEIENVHFVIRGIPVIRAEGKPLEIKSEAREWWDQEPKPVSAAMIKNLLKEFKECVRHGTT
jgi:hypothetical protein